jgi:alpha/beta superfamily hydrolase
MMRERRMKEEQVTFASGELRLEAMIAKPSPSSAERGAVVCHPHPLYGGSMYNNVVEAALEAMWRLGWATLRFNFRGVGQSEGEHSGGSGEADDAAAAVCFLAGELAVSSQKIALSGYSFGAMAAVKAISKLTDLGALMLIALPLRMTPADALKQINAPLILAAGDRDDYCPPAQLLALQQALGSRAQLKIIHGADHFFVGYEAELADALEAMLKSI